MHILLLSDHCLPEIKAPSFRIRDHAKYWIEAGHQVTVVTCAPNSPHGKVYPGYRNRLYYEEEIDGVRVIRLWSFMAPQAGVTLRTLDYLSFAISIILFAWRLPKHDVIVATSPPLFVPLAGFFVSLLRRRPWVFEIRDLWPASITAVGAAKKGLAIRLLEKMELFLYRKAHGIIALTDSFVADIRERGARPKRVDVIPNGVDTSLFNEEQVAFDARDRLGISADKILVAYVGTVGMAHGLETVIECAEMVKDRPEVEFLILGEGAERANIESLAKEKQLTNVHFHDYVPQDEIPSYWAAIDIAVVHLRPHPVFKTVIPSKIFEIMAMGVPMIYGVEGESAKIVESAQAGLCIPSGDSKAMHQSLIRLLDEPELREELSRHGQANVTEHFSRKAKSEQMIQFLTRLTARKDD